MEQYIIDIILAGVFVISTAIFFIRGFAKTALKFAAFFGAITCSKIFLSPITDWIFKNTKLFAGTEKYIAKLIIMVLCFLVFLFVLNLIARAVEKIFSLPVLKQANKVLGGAMGAVVGIILVVILSVTLQISARLVYNTQYVTMVKNSVIVQAILPEEKMELNIEALK